MEEIKKFKNGKIKLQVCKKSFYKEENGSVNENFYHDEMFMNDLYLNQIDGYMYLVDFNKSLVYEIGSYLMQNPLKEILETLENCKPLYFYPLSKKQSKSLLQDLENGY
jgi:hypothetical protein